MKTYVQQIMLGTVTGSPSRAAETLKRIKAAGYDGLELNQFMIHPSSLMVRMMTRAAGMPTGNGGKLDWHGLLAESGLSVVSLHTDLGSLEREPEAVMEEAGSFGTDKIVITGMYRFDYGNEAEVRKLAERLNKAGEGLRKAGFSLLYHNHNVELLPVGSGDHGGLEKPGVAGIPERSGGDETAGKPGEIGTAGKSGKAGSVMGSGETGTTGKHEETGIVGKFGTAGTPGEAGTAEKPGKAGIAGEAGTAEPLRAYDILLQETEEDKVGFEFDSYWFTDGGADAGAWMRKLGRRMKLWHINDRGSRQSGPAMTPILKADSMELGTGNMDLEGLWRIALANGVEEVVLESHKNWIEKDPVKSLELSARWLERNE